MREILVAIRRQVKIDWWSKERCDTNKCAFFKFHSYRNQKCILFDAKFRQKSHWLSACVPMRCPECIALCKEVDEKK